MKCENCKSNNVRRSSWRKDERGQSHFVYAPYRCRECEHRFVRISRTFKGTIIGGLCLLGFFGFITTMLLMSHNAQVTAAPDHVKEFENSRNLLMERAKKGNPEDQYAVGMMYLRGDESEQSYTEALKWFDLAAKKSHAGAELNLGLLYKNGRGVLQDFSVAAQWFDKAARLGNPEAQYQLGTLYKVGEGIKHDMKQAYAWYNLAAAEGYDPAVAARDSLVSFMSAAEIEAAQALSRELVPTIAKSNTK